MGLAPRPQAPGIVDIVKEIRDGLKQGTGNGNG